MHITRVTAFTALLLSFAPGAGAEPNPASGEPPPWNRPIPSRHRHDGFYLRFASGFGAYDERLSSDDDAPGGKIEGRNRGSVSVGELAIGGTIADGWVLGGGIYTADLLASTYRSAGDTTLLPPSELDPGLRSLGLFGPFVDYYPNPSGGFHFQAALGLATLTPRVFGSSATEQSEYLALGGGLMLGAGYEVWVDDEWSLGILSRTTAVGLGGTDDADVGWAHFVITSPSLLVTLTYH